ncbi:MAG: FAD-dependent oxidoreductase, partial [Cyanobacteria bacterium]|nr:FAD-dependent oxidoreductase [Cyanobacteriota bacterium]
LIFDTSLKKFVELSQMKTGQRNAGSHPPETNSLGSEFERIKRQMTHWLQDPDFPKIPLSDASPQAMKLDDITFLDYLRGNHYSEALIQYINAYCYSALGGSVSQVSAYSGINFYSEITGPIYAFPGGNARVGQTLVEKINAAGEHRFRTGVSVYQMEQKPSGKVWVSYFNQASGEATTIECNAVILAIPYFFASRIIPNLPTRWRDILKASQYGSYLVANLCFKERVFSHGYDHWNLLGITGDTPLPFTDFIDAQYTTDPSHRKAGQVLTVYAPFQEPHMGRGLLLQGNQRPLAEGIVSGLQKTLNFPLNTLEEVRLTRYGHQLLTPTPGRMKLLRSLHHQLDEANTPYCFAHSDGQGLPSIESAILQGLKAAEDVKRFL